MTTGKAELKKVTKLVNQTRGTILKVKEHFGNLRNILKICGTF